MKGLFPDEFPFSRKRKASRRKSATGSEQQPLTSSAHPITADAPAPAPAAPPEAVMPQPAAHNPAPAPSNTVAPLPPVERIESAAPVLAVRHATSRASITPVAAVSMLPRPAEAPADPGYKGPERRKSPRQSLRAKAMYRNELNAASSGAVQILNVSMCGVRIWSPRPMKLGERGNLKMEIGPVKWASRVKVVNCESREDDGFSLGCEFAGNEVARRSVA